MAESKTILETCLFFCYYVKVRAFRYTRFNRFANKEGITDNELLEIVEQLEADQADANLGGAQLCTAKPC
ncbi:hypothetical protein R84B8_03258 [Treponema sp. R8-4-B8]